MVVIVNIKVLLFVLCLASLSNGLSNDQVSSADFCYEGEDCGPETWDGQCQIGKNQSPIAIKYFFLFPAHPVKLDFNNKYKNEKFWIVNNGHTIQVTLDATATSAAQITGYELDSPYKFAQIHFHWGKNSNSGSEHSVNNKFFPMEAHLVHYHSKFENFTVAANSDDPKALAVIAIFIDEGQNSNEAIDVIADNIPKFNPNNESEATPINKQLDLSSLLPKSWSWKQFYRYFGSLTTPPCTENVLWTVFKDPIYVKPASIQKFRQQGIEINYRPIQDIGERRVKTLIKNNFSINFKR